MSKLSLNGFLFCVVACAACNSESPAPGTPVDLFIGKWACSEELSLTFTSPPGQDPQTTTERTTLTIAPEGSALAASKQSDGGANCKVSFISNGSTGTLVEGQTCTTADGITIAYKSGSATVSGSSMNSAFSFDASGNITVGGMMVPVMATGTQNSTCSRLTAPPSGGGTTTGGW